MPLLDTKTVTVGTVVAPTAAGSIVTIEYWNPVTGAWGTTPPTDILLGAQIGVRPQMQNTGTRSQDMWVRTQFKRPDGTTLPWVNGDTIRVSPGVTVSAGAFLVTTDRVGAWTAVLELYGEVII